MKLVLTLPAFNPTADDVADRELVVAVDGVANDPAMLGNDPAMLSHEVTGLSQGQTVTCTLRNVDDGDPANFSDPVTFTGTANVSGSADTLPPAAPGEMSGVFVEE